MTLSAKVRRFVEEYVASEDLNATQAALRAGYSKKTARTQASQIMQKPEVQEAITAAMKARSKRTEITQDDVLRRWFELANADPNELTSVIVGSCRFCHGTDHQYQWRDEAEFKKAQEAHLELPDAQRVKSVAPVIGGGFGYKWRLAPHPDCPRCDGIGRARTVIRDTTDLSAGGKALFAGVKETQQGVEIKMHDQAAALVNVAKHLGMFPNKVEHSGPDGGPVTIANMTEEQMEARLAELMTKHGSNGS